MKSQTLFFRFMCISCALVVWTGCSKNEDPEIDREYPEYIVFGRYNPATWCAGETCVELFKVETKGLFEDVLDQMPTAGTISSTAYSEALSQIDFNQVVALLERKSYEKLLNYEAFSIGSMWPDNAHFYFEYKSKTQHRSWLIDGTFDGSVPSDLQPFLADVNQMWQVAAF
jgi:hypothetical protein